MARICITQFSDQKSHINFESYMYGEQIVIAALQVQTVRLTFL